MDDYIVLAPPAVPEDYGTSPWEREIEDYISYGMVIIDKPMGPSSHQVTSWVKEILDVKRSVMDAARPLAPELVNVAALIREFVARSRFPGISVTVSGPEGMHIVLASASVRRRMVLEAMGLVPDVRPADVRELTEGRPVRVAVLPGMAAPTAGAAPIVDTVGPRGGR